MERAIAQRPTPATCLPITCNRELSDCWVAGAPLAELQRGCLARVDQTALSVYVRSDAWVPCTFLSKLVEDGITSVYVDDKGEFLAWTAGTAAGPAAGALTRDAPGECFLIRYAWDLLAVNEYALGKLARDDIAGVVSDRAEVHGVLVLGKNSCILPGVYIEGNVVIGRDCKIGPNCYIRGTTAIGDGCRIGHSVEIKNSIIMPGASIGHLSYCGDSIVGVGTNLGAGTITANFRHDGGHHKSMVEGQLLDTGRTKLGAIIGDHVHTGINTSIYPGRKIWPGLSTRPGDVVQRDLKP